MYGVTDAILRLKRQHYAAPLIRDYMLFGHPISSGIVSSRNIG